MNSRCLTTVRPILQQPRPLSFLLEFLLFFRAIFKAEGIFISWPLKSWHCFKLSAFLFLSVFIVSSGSASLCATMLWSFLFTFSPSTLFLFLLLSFCGIAVPPSESSDNLIPAFLSEFVRLPACLYYPTTSVKSILGARLDMAEKQL